MNKGNIKFLSADFCFFCRYNWRSTEWSDCRVDVLLSQQDRRRSNQTGLCGGGFQTREVYCVQAPSETSSNLGSLKSKDGNKTGRFIVLTFCLVAGLGSNDSLIIFCHTPTHCLEKDMKFYPFSLGNLTKIWLFKHPFIDLIL